MQHHWQINRLAYLLQGTRFDTGCCHTVIGILLHSLRACCIDLLSRASFQLVQRLRSPSHAASQPTCEILGPAVLETIVGSRVCCDHELTNGCWCSLYDNLGEICRLHTFLCEQAVEQEPCRSACVPKDCHQVSAYPDNFLMAKHLPAQAKLQPTGSVRRPWGAGTDHPKQGLQLRTIATPRLRTQQ